MSQTNWDKASRAALPFECGTAVFISPLHPFPCLNNLRMGNSTIRGGAPLTLLKGAALSTTDEEAAATCRHNKKKRL